MKKNLQNGGQFLFQSDKLMFILKKVSTFKT